MSAFSNGTLINWQFDVINNKMICKTFGTLSLCDILTFYVSLSALLNIIAYHISFYTLNTHNIIINGTLGMNPKLTFFSNVN